MLPPVAEVFLIELSALRFTVGCMRWVWFWCIVAGWLRLPVSHMAFEEWTAGSCERRDGMTRQTLEWQIHMARKNLDLLDSASKNLTDPEARQEAGLLADRAASYLADLESVLRKYEADLGQQRPEF